MSTNIRCSASPCGGGKEEGDAEKVVEDMLFADGVVWRSLPEKLKCSRPVLDSVFVPPP